MALLPVVFVLALTAPAPQISLRLRVRENSAISGTLPVPLAVPYTHLQSALVIEANVAGRRPPNE